MKFVVYGPFELGRTVGGLISKDFKNEFLDRVEMSKPGLSDACGCYVFRINPGRGAKPWYVGKAEKKTFADECFTADKMLKYITAYDATNRYGLPELFLLAQVTPKRGVFSKPTKHDWPYIDELELMLIREAFKKNPELLNMQGIGKARKIEIEGFLNSRKARSGPAKALQETLGMWL